MKHGLCISTVRVNRQIISNCKNHNFIRRKCESLSEEGANFCHCHISASRAGTNQFGESYTHDD